MCICPDVLTGVRSRQKKSLAMPDLDSDDDECVSSSSTTWSDQMSVNETDDVQKDKLLDQALDALYEERLLIIHFSIVNIGMTACWV